MNEEYKISKDYPQFAANKDGGVMSVVSGKVRKLTLNKNGYMMVGSRQGTYYVHRIVATAYIPNPENKSEVNHKNCDKADNRLCNLEWVTRSENMIHAARAGRLVFNGLYGEDSNLALYTTEEITNVCELLAEGGRVIDVAKATGIPRSYVKSLKQKKSWKSITEKYTFNDDRKVSISSATVEWVCKEIAAGCGNTEILNKARCKSLTLPLIKNIKYKNSHVTISDRYF